MEVKASQTEICLFGSFPVVVYRAGLAISRSNYSYVIHDRTLVIDLEVNSHSVAKWPSEFGDSLRPPAVVESFPSHRITDSSSESEITKDLLRTFITKYGWTLLQSATAIFITKSNEDVLQSATASLIKCDWGDYKVRQVLQSATVHTFLILYYFWWRCRGNLKLLCSPQGDCMGWSILCALWSRGVRYSFSIQ